MYPYHWPVSQLQPGMILGYTGYVVTDVSKTGDTFQRGNAGTYYDEWKVELTDPTDSSRHTTYRNLTEFDGLTVMLDEESQPIKWKEGMEPCRRSSGSLF